MSRKVQVSHTHKDHLTRILVYLMYKLKSVKIANSHWYISEHKNIFFCNNHSKIT